ncbi:MAG: hypothetical protein WCP31_09600 [Chloroflexales bacterium]
MHHLIKVALVLLASVAAFLVYGFTTLIAPWPVAVFAAGSLVSTYIGLAFADISVGQQHNAVRVAVAAMVIEALYGTLYVLSGQYPAFFAAPPWYAAIPLAALHGASFSVLAFFVSLFVFHAQRSAEPVEPVEVRIASILAGILAGTAPAVPEQARYPAPALLNDAGNVASIQPIETPQTAHRTYCCPQCGSSLNQQQYGAAVRYHKCKQCPSKGV